MGGCSSSEKEELKGSSVDSKNKGVKTDTDEIKDSDRHVNQQQNSIRENPQSKGEDNSGDLVECDEMAEKKVTKDGRVADDEKRSIGGHDDDGVGDVTAATKAKPEVEEVVDIDLDDPEVKKAATLIQSGFMGRMARKKMAAKQNDPKIVRVDEKHTKPEEDENLASPKPKLDNKGVKKPKSRDEAATKIQAGMRGMMVRRKAKPRNKELRTEDDDQRNGTKIEDDDDEAIDYDGTMEDEKKKAATKIQSGVRGMQVRKKVKEDKGANCPPVIRKSDDDVEDEDEEDDNDGEDAWQKNNAANKIQAGYKGMKARQHVKEIKNNEIDKKDNNDAIKSADDRVELLNKSATKIQAGMRGMKARKEMKTKGMKIQRSYSLSQAGATARDDTDEDTDTDKDTDMDKAATKIQAGLRGMKVRRNLKKQHSEGGELAGKNSPHNFNREEDEVTKAASKIQAGARGMKVRMEMKRRMSEGGRDNFDQSEKDKAAVKIQAGLRGMKTRRELKNRRQMTLDDAIFEPLEEEPAADEAQSTAATKIQAGVRGMQTRRNMKRRRSADNISPLQEFKENLKLNPDDAATKIQAGVRGMKTRNDLQKKREEMNKPSLRQYGQSSMDIDRAASKIQAGVRGMRARNDLQLQKASWKTLDSDALGSTDFD